MACRRQALLGFLNRHGTNFDLANLKSDVCLDGVQNEAFQLSAVQRRIPLRLDGVGGGYRQPDLAPALCICGRVGFAMAQDEVAGVAALVATGEEAKQHKVLAFHAITHPHRALPIERDKSAGFTGACVNNHAMVDRGNVALASARDVGECQGPAGKCSFGGEPTALGRRWQFLFKAPPPSRGAFRVASGASAVAFSETTRLCRALTLTVLPSISLRSCTLPVATLSSVSLGPSETANVVPSTSISAVAVRTSIARPGG